MKNAFLVLVVFALITSVGCDSGQKKEAATTTAPTAAASAQAQVYPRIPAELVMKVWDEGTMIDYLFHDLPFSMSQDEQNSIRSNLTYIGEDPVTSIPKGCKPMARQFYQVAGDILYEADIYFQQGCQFYVFIVDGKPTYANQMSDAGVKFFTQMINQAMQARQNAQ